MHHPPARLTHDHPRATATDATFHPPSYLTPRNDDYGGGYNYHPGQPVSSMARFDLGSFSKVETLQLASLTPTSLNNNNNVQMEVAGSFVGGTYGYVLVNFKDYSGECVASCVCVSGAPTFSQSPQAGGAAAHPILPVI